MAGAKPQNGYRKNGPSNRNFDTDFGWKHDRYQPFDQAYKNQRNPTNARYNPKVRANGTYSENNDWAHDKFVDLEREFNVKKDFKRKRRPDRPLNQGPDSQKNTYFNGKQENSPYYSNHSKNTDNDHYNDNHNTPERESNQRKGSGNSNNTNENYPETPTQISHSHKPDFIVDLCIVIDGIENRIDINLDKVLLT